MSPFSTLAAIVCLCAVLAAAKNPTCTIDTPEGKLDISKIPTAKLEINQTFKGKISPYTWVIDLCTPRPRIPGSAPCNNNDEEGFIFEYSGETCETSWTSVFHDWAYEEKMHALTATFINSKGWEAVVYLGCGTEYDLKPVGSVDVTTDFRFTFVLTSLAACPGTHPVPTPKPHPPPPTPSPKTPKPAPHTPKPEAPTPTPKPDGPATPKPNSPSTPKPGPSPTNAPPRTPHPETKKPDRTPSPGPHTPMPQPPNSSPTFSAGEFAGGMVGGVALGVFLGVAVCYFYNRNDRGSSPPSSARESMKSLNRRTTPRNAGYSSIQ